MRFSGFSIIEVIVMMTIMSFSILGVYSMVHSGQQFAQSTDDRLTALNIARSGIESVVALRDSFRLRSNDNSGCVFTIDGQSEGSCPEVSRYYLIDDDGLLEEATTTPPPVFITSSGWYSQETPATDTCGGDTTIDCVTRFSRVISFDSCPSFTLTIDCIKVISTVALNGADIVTLDQVLTRS